MSTNNSILIYIGPSGPTFAKLAGAHGKRKENKT
jgi:hypothetical protein